MAVEPKSWYNLNGNGNFSVGPTELGLRGNQVFLTLTLNPNTAVILEMTALGLGTWAYIRDYVLGLG